MNGDLFEFYSGKRVFLTGHTGFKGSWLSFVLSMAGAEVMGYSLPAPTEPSAFRIMNIGKRIRSEIGDVRDAEHISSALKEFQPEIVFHLAAQPLVRQSYLTPRETYETNVMGTVNLLEAVRGCKSVKSVLNVTTDKVYENADVADHAFEEWEKLDGFDPYSNSKSCSELVTHSYKKSFFGDENAPRISTARAGNVIGGGDFSKDRIIPDCVRAVKDNNAIIIRNPDSTRPFQHVLEPLFAYLMIAMKQTLSSDAQDYYNVGPNECDCISAGKIAELFVKEWGNGAKWVCEREKNAPHEASFLMLNCEKIKKKLGWIPRWNIEDAVKKTAQWYKAWLQSADMERFTQEQIIEFCNLE